MSRVFGVNLAAILVLSVFLLGGVPVSAAEIRIGAGPATITLILKPLQEPFEKATGITLDYTQMNAREAVPLLLKRELDMIATSQPADVYLNALERGEVTFDRKALRSADVARVPLSVIVHKSNSISSLTKEQLKGIFSGTIRSWDEVGGPDVPIDVFYYGGYTPDDALEHAVIGENRHYEDLQRPQTPAGARTAVASAPAAIGVIPSDLVEASVKKLESPEIAQLPAFITNGEPSEAVRKLIDFIKGEGRKYLILE